MLGGFKGKYGQGARTGERRNECQIYGVHMMAQIQSYLIQSSQIIFLVID